MIDTVIVSGGNIHKGFALDFLKKIIKEAGRENIRLVAADKGLEFFGDTELVPDQIVGDFDSLSEEGKKYLKQIPKEKVIRLKPEKDDTDTQSALKAVIEGGARDVAILGATGTRLDHVLSNVGLLTFGEKLGARITLWDANNYISLAKSGTVLHRDRQFGKYVSFFTAEGDVRGLTLEGFKYTVKEKHLTAADCGLMVSNEILEEKARITYESGSLLMIMSRD